MSPKIKTHYIRSKKVKMHCGEPVRRGNSRSTSGTSSHPQALPSATALRALHARARPPPPQPTAPRLLLRLAVRGCEGPAPDAGSAT